MIVFLLCRMWSFLLLWDPWISHSLSFHGANHGAPDMSKASVGDFTVPSNGSFSAAALPNNFVMTWKPPDPRHLEAELPQKNATAGAVPATENRLHI